MKYRIPVLLLTVCATVLGLMGPAGAGKISATRNWTGHGSAYTSLYADVRRDCGFWTCTSWVTGVRHYSRDYRSTKAVVTGRHVWGGIKVSSATVGYKSGSISLSSAGGACTITVVYTGVKATFEGGGRVCAAKSNFVVYHDESLTVGRHERAGNAKQMTVRAS